MDRDTFYGRFSTASPPATAQRRKALPTDAAAPPSPPEDREDFYGRFSTTMARESADVFGWVLEAKGSWGSPLQVLMMLIVAFDLVFAVVRPLVVEPMRVPSGSMSPTLQAHDRVLTNKLAYDFSDPRRGDLVVFESVNPQKDDRLVKRVVGLPGDEISLQQDGTLLLNGVPQNEPYAKKSAATKKNLPTGEDFGPTTVPEDHVFVLGDNRANSRDSRYFGPVPTKNLVGKPSLRFWPPDRLGTP